MCLTTRSRYNIIYVICYCSISDNNTNNIFCTRQSHLAAKGLLHRSFPHYNELAYVFGKDRAMGCVQRPLPLLARMCQEVTMDFLLTMSRYEVPYDVQSGTKHVY